MGGKNTRRVLEATELMNALIRKGQEQSQMNKHEESHELKCPYVGF